MKEPELERDGEESRSRLHTVRSDVPFIVFIPLYEKTYDINIGPSVCNGQVFAIIREAQGIYAVSVGGVSGTFQTERIRLTRKL